MHSSPKLFALAAAALLSSSSSTTSASPLKPNPTSTSTSTSSSSPLQTNTVNCTDPSTGLAPACWFTLNMTTWLNNWVSTSPYTNQVGTEQAAGSTNASTATTTTNGTQTSGNPFVDEVTVGNDPSNFFRKRTVGAAIAPASGQCQGGKPFSTCFSQLQPGYRRGKDDCSRINTGGVNGTCPAPRVADYANNPQAYYAAWNFYSINAYLSTFHQSLTTLAHTHPTLLTTAATSAYGSPYISYFDPSFSNPNKTLSIDTPLLDLLIRSTAGHELPGGQNTPFLHLLELEDGKESGVVYGAGATAEELRGMMQGRLEEVLGAVMGDARVFGVVAGNGAFSTRGFWGVRGREGVKE